MTDEQFHDLIERAHQVSELVDQPGWRVLAEEITRRADAEQRRLLDGQAESVEEYRAWAGWIQGAKAALLVPERLAERVERERKRRDELKAVAA